METGTTLGGNGRPEEGLRSERSTDSGPQVAEEDLLRANFYALLARMLARPMDDETLAFARSLDGGGGDSELGRALASFGALAVRTSRDAAEEEFTELFFGRGAGGELTPYGSYYMTGMVYDRPLAELRQDMAELGIGRSDDNKEPEDHIASLCEMMHGLITGTFGCGVLPLERQRAFFSRHLAPWARRFFEDLEGAESATLYMPLGTVGRLFMAVEGDAFRMAA